LDDINIAALCVRSPEKVTPITSKFRLSVRIQSLDETEGIFLKFLIEIQLRETAMTIPLQVTFRNMKHSPQVEDWIRAEAEKLETFYHRITACRVAVEVPHRHHKKGKPLHIRIDLTLPGKEIVIKREPVTIRRPPVNGEAAASSHVQTKSPHADLQLVIHDAFKAAGRRVQDFARRQRGQVKKHEAVLARA
jgi:hypothetical protein